MNPNAENLKAPRSQLTLPMIKTIFSDKKRRTKQQLLQSLGLSKGTDDSDFAAEHAEYKATTNALLSLQQTFKKNLESLKASYQTSSALSVELAAFNRNTSAFQGSVDLVNGFSALEGVQLAAAHRLYEEQAVAEINQLLWQVPEVEAKVKERKALMLDLNSHRRKFETAQATLIESQNNGGNINQNPSRGILGGRKGESELSADLATRRVRLDHAETAVNEITEWLRTQFRELLDARESGILLAGPMTAFYVCQKRLAQTTSTKLESNKRAFPECEKYEAKLTMFENEFAKHHSNVGANFFAANDAMAGMNIDSGRPVVGCFGTSLADQPACGPILIRDCIDYLNECGGLEADGLFRVSGSMDVVQHLQKCYDRGETNCFESVECGPHEVATLLKLYLRELPESLIPQAVYHDMVAAANDPKDPAEAIAQIMGDLPDYHLVPLSAILQLLYRVGRRSDVNKMTFSNLATCLAPTVLAAPEDVAPSKAMNDMPFVIFVIKTLIEQAKRYDLSRAQPVVAPLVLSRRQQPHEMSYQTAAY